MSWFRRFPARRPAAARLFCFPHAGAGAASFNVFVPEMPADMELAALTLPGREQRLRDAPFTRLPPLIEHLTAAIEPHLDLPFVFVGHSLGALIAFELTRSLRRSRLRAPSALLVSGRQAPHLPDRRPPVHHLDDEVLIEELKAYAGTASAALADRELMELVLPVLRADLEMGATYTYAAAEPLATPILALGGVQDPDVTEEELEAWGRHTKSEFQARLFEGGHFFLYRSPSARRSVLDEAARRSRTSSSSSDSM